MWFSRNRSFQLVSVLTFVAISIHAQATDPVPLKNWPAPLSWRATTPHEGAVAREDSTSDSIKPQLSTSGGTIQLGVLVAITPCRLVDSRSTMPVPFGSGTSSPLTWTAGSQTTIPVPTLTGGPYYYGSGTSTPVTNPCNGLPAAIAYSASITVVPQPTLQWLSVCPTGTPTATCSKIAALTDYQGAPVLSSPTVIPSTAAGSFDVFVENATQVIVDINGYYLSPDAVTLGVGTAAAPSLTFTGDSTTGVYSPGPGTVDIATGGANRLTITSNGNVGIGTTTPAFPVDVVGTLNANNPATSGNANGVQGISNSPNGAGVNGFNSAAVGYPVGVEGSVNGTVGAGVSGNATKAGAVGVSGYNSATSGYAVGVSGGTASNSGAGVQGNSSVAGAYAVSGFNSATSGFAVGTQGVTGSPNGVGVLAQSMQCTTNGCTNTPGTAAQFTASNATGSFLLKGFAGPTGSSPGGNNVFNVDGLGDAFFAGWVQGNANASGSSGIQGNSAFSNAAAVHGYNSATSGYAVGVQGGTASSNGAGVQGNASVAGASGVNGFNSATSGYAVGVSGGTASNSGAGVSGNSNVAGVFGTVGFNSATSGYAVGTEGASSSPGGVGLLGVDWNCLGGSGCTLVAGTGLQLQTATTGMLIVGQAGSAGADNNTATTAFSVDGQGDGYFKGNLNVGGTLSKSSGSFRIDDPIDPENKYLYHSFVESPDMMNIYNGIVTVDAHGEATVTLPAWFEALNMDFRYQLTCIGGYAPVYIASEVSGNEFRIAGGHPGLKVSWQVTGIRHDAYANAHRIPVEVDKPANARGMSPLPAMSDGATSGTLQHR